MERPQNFTVGDVVLSRRGYCISGTLTLTSHHLVFRFNPNDTKEGSDEKPAKPKEIWICYPIIGKMSKSRGSALLENRNNPFNSAVNSNFKDGNLSKYYESRSIDHYSASNIRIQCKDFTFYSFDFVNDMVANEVYHKLSTQISLPKVQRNLKLFYAYSYRPNVMESNLAVKGWDLFNPEEEYTRLGLANSGDEYWRVTTLNEEYKLCDTYPNLIVVPGTISDTVLKHAVRFRSKNRLPAIVYKHRLSANGNIIARCAQPLVGLNIQNRSIQDEKVITEIFKCHERERKENLKNDSEFIDQPQKNLIVDLRPITNAMAQHAMGAGTENIDFYRGKLHSDPRDSQPAYMIKNLDKIFCNIDNVHVMTDSLNKLFAALNDLDNFPVSLNADDDQISYAALQHALSKSQWLNRLSIILQAVDRITKSVHLNNTNVLIHCSDGWDRTSQTSALLQLCLDPYYRTLKGFMVLIEKEWVSFGFKFSLRADHGGCIGAILPKPPPDAEQNDSNDNSDEHLNGGAAGVASFLQKAANKAATRIRHTANAAAQAGHNIHRPPENALPNPESSSEPNGSNGTGTSTPSSNVDTDNDNEEQLHRFFSSRTYNGTVNKSPIFHQFIDCVYQIIRQHPEYFEFNSRFLKRLFYHYYSCQYGSFLCDTERELRHVYGLQNLTVSVWDYFNSRPNEFTNPKYNPQDEVLFFNYSDIKWWTELYGRSDEEMNGLSNSLDRKFAKINLNK